MTDTNEAKAPAADSKPVKGKKGSKATGKTGKKTPAPNHPSYKIMITAAVKSLNEKSGSSRQAILKYIIANYKVGDEKKAGTRLRIAIVKMVGSGDLKQVKGSGASGSFRLAGDSPAPTSSKPAPKKKIAKSTKKATKPKKPSVKKTTKPKKSPKKASPPKKAPAKKTTKRTAAKKAAAK